MTAALGLAALAQAAPAASPAAASAPARDCIAIGLAKGATLAVGGHARAIAEDQPVVIDDCVGALFQKIPVQVSYLASRQPPLVLSYASQPRDEGHPVGERVTIVGSIRAMLEAGDDDDPMGGQYPAPAPGGAASVKTGLFTVKGSPGGDGMAWFVADADLASPTGAPAARASQAGASAPLAELRIAAGDTGEASGSASASAPAGSSWVIGAFAGSLVGTLHGGLGASTSCATDMRGHCLVVGRDYTLVPRDSRQRLRGIFVPPEFYDQSLAATAGTPATPAERLRKGLNGIAVQLITAPDTKAAADARARLAAEFPSLKPSALAR